MSTLQDINPTPLGQPQEGWFLLYMTQLNLTSPPSTEFRSQHWPDIGSLVFHE